MIRGFCAICFSSFIIANAAVAQPTQKQVSLDAADFHQFRITTLVHANELNKGHSNSTPGLVYLRAECKKLAQRTSPEYLYGIVYDLMQDTSRTEEPYFIAVMVLDYYPPEQARVVVKKIIDDPKYKACGDVKNWLWEIDEAQKNKDLDDSASRPTAH